MKKTSRVTYSLMNSAFKKANARINPSEFHGLQVGLICGDANEGEQHHIKLQLDELACSKITDSLINLIMTSYAKSSFLLKKNAFEFSLVLPSDKFLLKDRVKALSNWCTGFLSGLGLAGVSKEKFEEEIIQEIIQDLSKIAAIDINASETESEEAAYVELLEYVKVAVQNVMLEVHREKIRFYEDNEFVVH